jgi:hypothetical protein
MRSLLRSETSVMIVLHHERIAVHDFLYSDPRTRHVLHGGAVRQSKRIVAIADEIKMVEVVGAVQNHLERAVRGGSGERRRAKLRATAGGGAVVHSYSLVPTVWILPLSISAEQTTSTVTGW